LVRLVPDCGKKLLFVQFGEFHHLKKGLAVRNNNVDALFCDFKIAAKLCNDIRLIFNAFLRVVGKKIGDGIGDAYC